MGAERHKRVGQESADKFAKAAVYEVRQLLCACGVDVKPTNTGNEKENIKFPATSHPQATQWLYTTTTCNPDGFCQTAPSAQAFLAHPAADRLLPQVCPVSPALWSSGSHHFKYDWPAMAWPAKGGAVIVEVIFTRCSNQAANTLRQIERGLIALDAAQRDASEPLHPLNVLELPVWAALGIVAFEDPRTRAATEYTADTYGDVPRCRLLSLRSDLLWLKSCKNKALVSEWFKKEKSHAMRQRVQLVVQRVTMPKGLVI
ncbi:hypothetical protein WJX72_008856 [[Myrmecia] bisecta]|uniref:Uncharacterized protein n=1 Tax=[Myrmecia] bisecta TaxID=41462 RepID=A0AAW1QG42_9CHLO